ncbi:MAG: M48 family metallopeptidase [Bacteroidia bacterium]|jgi:predicted Zn-dependent protease|nr:M48 family metallopeptidase [Bacteroidia bacterium]
MKRIALGFFAISLLFAWSCTRVPITKRRQFNLLPESTLIGMSVTEYQGFVSKNPIAPASDANVILVRKVGSKLQASINSFLAKHKNLKRVAGYKWEFNVVNDPKTINAWCMPGGKVMVYTGILPVTKDEAGLAVVMGHEVAHALARHGNERMSQQLSIQLGGMALSVALSQKPEQTQQIFQQVYGVGATLGALAYSRKHETEADKIGLCFMAMAGYNPTEAVGFWERMAKATGQGPPQFLSTHPSSEQRIKDIKAFLPTAQKYYTGAASTKAPAGQ